MFTKLEFQVPLGKATCYRKKAPKWSNMFSRRIDLKRNDGDLGRGDVVSTEQIRKLLVHASIETT
jgi:hypothetical protein